MASGASTYLLPRPQLKSYPIHPIGRLQSAFHIPNILTMCNLHSPPFPTQLPGAICTSSHSTAPHFLAPPKGATSPRTGTGSLRDPQRVTAGPAKALSPHNPTPLRSRLLSAGPAPTAPCWGARPKDPAPPGSGAAATQRTARSLTSAKESGRGPVTSRHHR